MTNWYGLGTENYGTWNKRGINGKEIELLQEIKLTTVKILALTETKKKGQLDMLFFSDVPNNERARVGIACLVHKDEVSNTLG